MRLLQGIEQAKQAKKTKEIPEDSHILKNKKLLPQQKNQTIEQQNRTTQNITYTKDKEPKQQRDIAAELAFIYTALILLTLLCVVSLYIGLDAREKAQEQQKDIEGFKIEQLTRTKELLKGMAFLANETDKTFKQVETNLNILNDNQADLTQHVNEKTHLLYEEIKANTAQIKTLQDG